jgi:hypothetical protein
LGTQGVLSGTHAVHRPARLVPAVGAWTHRAICRSALYHGERIYSLVLKGTHGLLTGYSWGAHGQRIGRLNVESRPVVDESDSTRRSVAQSPSRRGVHFLAVGTSRCGTTEGRCSPRTARKGTQQGVLKSGYPKRATQKRVRKGVLKKGYSNRVLEFGHSKRVLKKEGTHRYSMGRRKCCGCVRPCLRDIGGQCAAVWSLHGVMAYYVVRQYVSGTHGVLAQWVLSPAAHGCRASLVSTRSYAATRGYSQGTHTVLPRYLTR